VGSNGFATGAKLVKLKSRRQRRFAENVKKLGVWVFLFLFVASIAGVVVVTSVASQR